jgi:hypothetical protein
MNAHGGHLKILMDMTITDKIKNEGKKGPN